MERRRVYEVDEGNTNKVNAKRKGDQNTKRKSRRRK